MSETPPADRLVTLPEGIPPYTLGWEAIGFASKYLRHPNGPRSGKRWEFVDSQIRFLLWAYALDEDGHWLYHHMVRRLVKGSGKSPFAAVWALIEFLAPVRLDDFDPNARGGVRGRPVSMPLVQIAATAESQTANTMRMIRALAPKNSRLVEDYQLDVGKTQFYRLPEGELQVITSSSSAAEGAEATAIVADETEHWKPSNGGPDMISTLRDNLTKSGNRMMETCNAWIPGEGSVSENSYEAWITQEEGRTRGESKILYDARIAPPDTDLADEASLRKALEHTYGDCYWADIRAIMQRIWDPSSRPDDSRRKYLNRPTAADDAWMPAEHWEVLSDRQPVEDGEAIAMFFDGSKSNDATALIGCRMSDGYVFSLGVWEPDRSGTSEVPAADVDRAVRDAFETYSVVGFFADVQEWESFVKVSWPEEHAHNLLAWALPSGKEPQPIAWDMRSRVYDFTLAAELTEREILDGDFHHDGNSAVRRHITNARRRPNRWGISIGKESPKSPKKIDAAVCVIGARLVRRQVLASDAWKRRARGRKVVIL